LLDSAIPAKVDLKHTQRDHEAFSVVEVVSLLRESKFYGQATKGARWMPWQKQAMKDVASCDKLREAAHRRYDPEISEWGNPPGQNPGMPN
jgi:hypothetical protein